MSPRYGSARRRRIGPAAALVLALAVCAGAPGQALQPVPELRSRVTDLTGTLTAEQQAALEQELADFEARKGAQIAVLIVPTTQPEPIEAYSIRVVEQWQLGRKGVDDGALLIVAKDDRRVRIEVGYGLEGALTDATANRITDETIVPLFRQGNFHGGISAGVSQMIRVIEGEPLPEPDRRWRGESPGALGLLIFLLFIVPVVALVLRAMFGRVLGALFTGGGTSALVWLLSRLVGISLLAGGLAFLYAVFAGMSRGTRWSSLPRHGGWGGGWSGGWGGGGGLRGGGFGGGFRGGGGGFGGGGASGRW